MNPTAWLKNLSLNQYYKVFLAIASVTFIITLFNLPNSIDSEKVRIQSLIIIIGSSIVWFADQFIVNYQSICYERSIYKKREPIRDPMKASNKQEMNYINNSAKVFYLSRAFHILLWMIVSIIFLIF
jgi:hypothetical protein